MKGQHRVNLHRRTEVLRGEGVGAGVHPGVEARVGADV